MSEEIAEAEVAEIEPVPDRPKPKSTEQKAALVDAATDARKLHAAAVERVNALTAELERARDDVTRARGSMHATRETLKREIEEAP